MSWIKRISLNLVLVLIGCFALSLVGATALAQNNGHSFARDTVAHDPYTGPHLTLNEEVKQVPYAKSKIWGAFLGAEPTTGFLGWRIFLDKLSHLHPAYETVVEDHVELFDFFKIHSDRYAPSVEYGPAVINAGFEYQGISDDKMGFCWGFATMNRDFTILAFYDPSQPKNESMDFYRAKIDQIMRGEAAIFPGFSNFRELSMVPELEMYLKLKAMEAWRKYAISVRAALFFFKTPKQMKKEQVTDFLSDLKTRLARGELPKLLIASKMQSKGRIHFSKYTHVVLARDVVEGEDGNIRIYIWDGNFFAETLKSTPKYIAVTPRGELIYQPWFEEGPQANESIRLTRIEYAPENDYETVRELYSLKKFCEGENSAFCSQK